MKYSSKSNGTEGNEQKRLLQRSEALAPFLKHSVAFFYETQLQEQTIGPAILQFLCLKFRR